MKKQLELAIQWNRLDIAKDFIFESKSDNSKEDLIFTVTASYLLADLYNLLEVYICRPQRPSLTQVSIFVVDLALSLTAAKQYQNTFITRIIFRKVNSTTC